MSELLKRASAAVDMANKAGADDAFAFVANFGNQAGEATISAVGANFLVRFDTTGDGVANGELLVQAPTLDAGDFFA